MGDVEVLVINAGDPRGVYQSLGSELAAVETPVWAGLIASYLRGKGVGVDILDANALGMSAAEAAAVAERRAPTLVVVPVYGHQPSASTQNMPASSALCNAIKDRCPELPVLLLGGHVAALPEPTLREERVDFVSDGEGLVTITDLLEVLKGGSRRYAYVRDLWYREDGQPTRSRAAAPLLRDLDEQIPGVAYDLLPMDRYRAHNWHCFGGRSRSPYASMYTTLGCPYQCSFCCIQAPFKTGEAESGMNESVNSYRFWSPDAVIAKIDELVNNYGVSNIKIADEMFVLNQRHVLGICDRIIERGYDLNIWAYARIDTVKEDMLDRLKRAGINWLALGIESGSERVRADISKSFDQEQIVGIVRKIQEHGIHVIGNFIFGLPEDDYETMRQTLDLAFETMPDFANFYSAMAYPGSDLYREASEHGWPLPSTWSGYSQHSRDCLPLPTNYLSAGEVLRFRDEAFHTFFSSPEYLSHVERKFGPETRDEIVGMTGIRLEREFAGAGGVGLRRSD